MRAMPQFAAGVRGSFRECCGPQMKSRQSLPGQDPGDLASQSAGCRRAEAGPLRSMRHGRPPVHAPRSFLFLAALCNSSPCARLYCRNLGRIGPKSVWGHGARGSQPRGKGRTPVRQVGAEARSTEPQPDPGAAECSNRSGSFLAVKSLWMARSRSKAWGQVPLSRLRTLPQPVSPHLTPATQVVGAGGGRLILGVFRLA